MSDPMSATYLGFTTKALVAAGGGGAVAMLIGPGSWRQRLTAGVVGTLVSLFGTPIALPLVSISIERATATALDATARDALAGATGFVLGVCGLIIARAITDVARGLRRRAPDFIGDQLMGDEERR